MDLITSPGILPCMDQRAAQVIDLRSQGLTYADIGAQVGVSTTTVMRTIAAHAPDMRTGSGAHNQQRTQLLSGCQVCGEPIDTHTLWTHADDLAAMRRSTATHHQGLARARLVFTSERNS